MEFPEGDTRATTARNKNGKPVILTTHHLDGDKANCEWTNLLSCCQRCHLHIQAVWQPGGVIPWPTVPQWIIDRALPFRVIEQLGLFGE